MSSSDSLVMISPPLISTVPSSVKVALNPAVDKSAKTLATEVVS